MSNEDIQKLIQSQQKIFIILAIMTLVSVGIAMLGSGGGIFILIAFAIAFIQGILILGNLMHVKESSSMRVLLGLSFFLVGFLLFASWLAFTDHIDGTDLSEAPAVVETTEAHDDGAEEGH